MTCFRHPFLVRGTIYTRHGAFQIQRGVLDAPDAVGDDCGWVRVEDADSYLERRDNRRTDPTHLRCGVVIPARG